MEFKNDWDFEEYIHVNANFPEDYNALLDEFKKVLDAKIILPFDFKGLLYKGVKQEKYTYYKLTHHFMYRAPLDENILDAEEFLKDAFYNTN